MVERRRFNQTSSLQDRLAAFALELREKAAATPPGPERDDLLERARKADLALDMGETVSLPKESGR